MLQPIEAALNICCGGYTALVGQFKEAGETLVSCASHSKPQSPHGANYA